MTQANNVAIESSQINSSGVLQPAGGGTGVTTSTGTGSNVLNTSPTLVTPALGTPSSGNLVNCTGLTSSQITTALGYTPANGLQSSGQAVITTSMTLTSAYAGSNILLIPSAAITITLPSTSNTFNLSNPTNYVINLVYPAGSDFKSTLQPGETVILAGDGGGYWRTVACGLQGGLQGAKSWVAATATGGTPTINGAYNVSSMTYTATGVFYINFINALPNANYSMYSHCSQPGVFTYSNNGQNTTGCGSVLMSCIY